MTGKQKKAVALLALASAIVLAVVWIGPPDPPDTSANEDLLTLSELEDLFDPEGGWIFLPLADSRYEAGVIMRVHPERGIRPISHLRECYPARLLEPTVGQLPSVEIDRGIEVDLGLVGSAPGIRLGPASRRVGAVGLRIDSLTTEATDYLRIAIWEDRGSNYDSVPSACRRELGRDDAFVVSEAARVNRGTYTFYDSAGSRIELTAERLADFVDADVRAAAEVTSEGRVVIRSPVTVAIRRAYRTTDGFEVLGDEYPEVTTADSLIRALIRRPDG